MSAGRWPYAFSRPPEPVVGRDFDLWCAEMGARGYSVCAMAERAGTTEGRVRSAITRVECGRYGTDGAGALRGPGRRGLGTD